MTLGAGGDATGVAEGGHDVDPQIEHQLVKDPAPKYDEPEADRHHQGPAGNTRSMRCANCFKKCRRLESLLFGESSSSTRQSHR